MYYLFHIEQVTVKRHFGMEVAEEGRSTSSVRCDGAQFDS